MLKTKIQSSQIAIAGRVLTPETNQPLGGAVVVIDKMPEKFKNILSLKMLQYGPKWERMNERLDRKITTIDGYFYFVNLPEGEYVIEAYLPHNGIRYQKAKKTVTVSHSSDGKIITNVTDIVLFSTGIKGSITDSIESEKAVLNAKIQVKDSGKTTFSDRKGNYCLLGIETLQSGQQTVTVNVSATGYQSVSQSVIIEPREITPNQNFSLTPT